MAGPAAARPDPFQHYRVTLERIVPMTPTVKSYTFALPDDARIRFKPGQYVQLYVPKGDGTVAKPYSIASPPDHERAIELCIKRVEGGYVSNYCDCLTGGESFEIRGPIGKFHLKEPIDSDLVFLATGTGVAPFRSMLHGLFPIDPGQRSWAPYQFHADPDHASDARHVWLIFGVRYEDEILYEHEFRMMAERYPLFHFIPTVSRPKAWSGATGYVQEQAVNCIQDPAGKQVYVCGLLPMIEGARTALKGMGFRREQIHYEIYT
ncbi:MAG TPA: FAD-binding oxidoreductase [Nitrospiria bacterium]|nr:FAD-binding oxidoreductase [Nitrospiria bacterium]